MSIKSLDSSHPPLDPNNVKKGLEKAFHITLIVLGILFVAGAIGGYIGLAYPHAWTAVNALTLGAISAASGIILLVAGTVKLCQTKAAPATEKSPPVKQPEIKETPKEKPVIPRLVDLPKREVPPPEVPKKSEPKKGPPYTAQDVATLFWLDPTVADTLEPWVAKINTVSEYLAKEGFELQGVRSDGDCFFKAYLEAYKQIRSQELNISELREQVASIVEVKDGARAQVIRHSKQWVNINEGDLLVHFFSLPIRTLTVEVEVDDTLTYSDGSIQRQYWSTLEEAAKPKDYLVIVDVGHHFLYATKRNPD